MTDSTWGDAIIQVFEKLRKVPDGGPALWRAIFDRGVALKKEGLSVESETLGHVAFRADSLREAYNYWMDVPPKGRARFEKKFLRAKISILKYPDSVEAYGELLEKDENRKDAEAVIRLFSENETGKLNDAHWDVVFRAFKVMGRWEEILPQMENLESIGIAEELLGLALDDDKEGTVELVLGRLITLMAGLSQWVEIRKLITSPFEKLHNWKFKNNLTFYRGLLSALPDNELFEGMPSTIKSPISKNLMERFGKDLSWRREIHPLKVGAALESMGKVTDTLEFYEMVGSYERLPEETRNFAWQRWAVAKHVQANLRNKKGKLHDKAEEWEEIARRKASELGFEDVEAMAVFWPEHLPPVSLPEEGLDEPAPIQNEAEDYSLCKSIDGISIRVNSDGNRMNLENEESLDNVAIRVVDKRVTMDGAPIELSESGEFVIEDWGVRVDLSGMQSGDVRIIWSDGLQVIFSVKASKLSN